MLDIVLGASFYQSEFKESRALRNLLIQGVRQSCTHVILMLCDVCAMTDVCRKEVQTCNALDLGGEMTW